MKNGRKAWLVWRFTNPIEIIGIYTTEKRAIAQCTSGLHGIGPLIVNAPSTHKSSPWDGSYYPKIAVK